MSPKGIGLFCLEASLRVFFCHITLHFRSALIWALLFQFLYVMFRLIVSMRSSNFYILSFVLVTYSYVDCFGKVFTCVGIQFRSWVHGCLFQIRARRNIRDDFCLTCVEQPSCPQSRKWRWHMGYILNLWQVNREEQVHIL